MSLTSKVWSSSSEVKKMFSATCHQEKISRERTYEDALIALNKFEPNPMLFDKSLQKKHLQKHDEKNTNLADFKKFLGRVDGFSIESLDKLSVIHVAGSKGKGSVCTYTEAFLSEYKVKTGLFTSPHLISVTERIKICGIPIRKELFNEYFWEIYDAIQLKKDDDDDLPSFFQFLLIMAFYVFVKENVEVVILEVGIGGEHCPTNIVTNTEVVGITSLQLEHVKLLGETLEEIAWQKSGIIKEDSYVFSLPQQIEGLRVINERFIEKNGKLLAVIQPFEEYKWSNLKLDHEQMTDVLKHNFSLSVQVSSAWLRNHNKISEEVFEGEILHTISDEFVNAFNKCQFDGRFQRIERSNLTYFLDGAHTKESMKLCSNWFSQQIENMENSINILVFNVTGERDSAEILSTLHSVRFDYTCFTTNMSTNKTVEAKIVKSPNFSDIVKNPQLDRCELHKKMWQRSKSSVNENSQVNVCSSIQDVLKIIQGIKNQNLSSHLNVLFTGSLHLIGSALRLLNSCSDEKS